MHSKIFGKRSWLEIDLEQLNKNYLAFKKRLCSNVEIMPVVKADAYGHGNVAVCKSLIKLGVKSFAVACVEEGIALRKKGIKGEILNFGYTPLKFIKKLIKYDITQAIISKEHATELESVGKKLKCQIAINTGMNRVGINANNTRECEELIREYYNKFNLIGIYTHLSVAHSKKEEDIKYTKSQIEKFIKISKKVKDLKLEKVHFMNSAGGLFYNFPKNINLVRVGIALYGLKPDENFFLPKEILPILTWKSIIINMQLVKKGESIGYGKSYVTKRPTWIATIPTGYADGYRRDLSNKGHVLIDGEKASIVGKICMDHMMIDVTPLIEKGKKISVNDQVVLIGKSKSAYFGIDDMAKLIGTIGYEIVSCISKRVDRIYIE